jgi:hypothetical protein
MNSIITPGRAREGARRIIEREVESRHEEEKKIAGWWNRWLIAVKIQKEVAAELNRRFPPGALYLQCSAR